LLSVYYRWYSYQYWNVLCFPLIFSCCSWLHLIRPLLINFGLKAVSLSCTRNVSSGGARDPKIQGIKRLHFHFILSEDVWHFQQAENVLCWWKGGFCVPIPSPCFIGVVLGMFVWVTSSFVFNMLYWGCIYNCLCFW
jgi:hypothetical protein